MFYSITYYTTKTAESEVTVPTNILQTFLVKPIQYKTKTNLFFVWFSAFFYGAKKKILYKGGVKNV